MPLKIKNIRVRDERQRGRNVNPSIIMEANEEVYPSADPVYNYSKDLQHRVIPCGPFFAVEVRPDTGTTYGPWVDVTEHPQGDIGKVNVSGIATVQLVPVTVNTPEELGVHLFMSVPRARRELRKSRTPFDIVMDENAALEGRIKWRVELSNPVCYGGAMPGVDNCKLKPTSTLLYRGVHLTLCPKHRRDKESRMQRDRITRKR